MSEDVTTSMERKLLDALASAPNGLSTSDLARLYDPEVMTMPRGGFAKVAAALGAILDDMLKRGFVLRTGLSAGWRITDAGRVALRETV